MNWRSNLDTAINALSVNKGRTALTSLGITIGIAAVIAMVAAGSGAKSKIDSAFAVIGPNLVVGFSGTTTKSGLRIGIAEGAFSQAFVPILAASRAKDGDEATHTLIDAVATVLLWALLLTCLVGVLGAPWLVWLMAAGFGPEAHDAAVVMTRWMFPYIGCMSLVALSAGLLNTCKRFAVPAEKRFHV